jgi:hypothetical protein
VKAKQNFVFYNKLKKIKNIKVLSEPIHKPKIKARSDLQKLTKERSSKS